MERKETPCECSSWCRVFADTGGILTEHHPRCEHHVGKQRYAKITLHGGATYVQPLDDLHQALDGELRDAEPGQRWTIELVEMYPEQYRDLPEFQGH